MYGITEEEKSGFSTYIAVAVFVVLAAGAIYLFFAAQQEKRDTTGFDPNRPVPTDDVLRRRLTPEQYRVVREGATQTAFQNDYWDEQRPGIYVDVITGEPLFTSLDKFDSGLGIPAFTKAISKDLLVELPDNSHDMQRTEVRAKRSQARLGHVFPDPKSPTGVRYSINSAALRFIVQDRMKPEGYEKYLSLLDKK